MSEPEASCLTFEDLQPGLRVNGLDPDGVATLIAVEHLGSDTQKVVYRSARDRLLERLLYRDDARELRHADARDKPWTFNADGGDFRLTAEALRLSLAAHFDPMLAVHTSSVEPLPHQLIAVYEVMLKRQPLRFLLADDPGAGKTVMAGLLIKEMIARGDLERCLVVAPGGLVQQWQDELAEKFQLRFQVVNPGAGEAATGFSDHNLCLARLDKLARDEDLQRVLDDTDWDLIVFDEAHKLSARRDGQEVSRTRRHQLAGRLSERTRHLLLMTATPHNGKDDDFELFLSLLDADRFEGRRLPRPGPPPDHHDLMRRMVKEQLRRFDGTPLFPERRAYTASYRLSPPEAGLYESVTDYVRQEFNRVAQLSDDGGRRGTVGFALTVLQRRLASSTAAVHASLSRRKQKLLGRLQEAEQRLDRGETLGKAELLDILQGRHEEAPDLDDDEIDLPADEVERREGAILDSVTAAATLDELRAEIATLDRLEAQAAAVRGGGEDAKWAELSKLLQEEEQMKDSAGNRRKIILFTEHRDTLTYLLDKVSTLLGKPDAIVAIHGGTPRKQRLENEARFREDDGVEVLLATDAAGEGLNLQRAHLLVNCDLPWNPNRLEQRFGRIHRIGQREVCHCWNLLAEDTREGEVYQRLLAKIEAQRDALGGTGAVFDVLGRLFEDTPLRDILREAVQHGDDPATKAKLFERVDMSLEATRVRRLIQEHALAADSLDLTELQELRARLERARANRLQPHHVSSWFEAAFVRAGGKSAPRAAGRIALTHVPIEIRRRASAGSSSHREPVLRRYDRVTFDKAGIRVPNEPDAAFLCPGHPLLDALIEHTIDPELLRRGATLVDPTDASETPSVLVLLQHEIHDATTTGSGDRRVVSRRLQHTRIVAEGGGFAFRSAGNAPYIDLRPLTDAESAALPPLDALHPADVEGMAVSFAAERLVPAHLTEVQREAATLLDKTEREVHARLTRAIQHADSRAAELKAADRDGKRTGLAAKNAARQADDLQQRLKERKAAIARQRQLSAATPRVLGAALVIPQGLLDRHAADAGNNLPAVDPDRRAELDRIAVAAVLAHQRSLGRQAVEMHHDHPGYDVEVTVPDEPGRLRFLEVKGKAVGRDTVTVSATQVRAACNARDRWSLAVVLIDGATPAKPAYVPGTYFKSPIDFGYASINLKLADLLSAAK